MYLLRLLSYRTPRGPQPAKLQKGLTRYPRLTRAQGGGELGRPVETPASPSKHTVLPTSGVSLLQGDGVPVLAARIGETASVARAVALRAWETPNVGGMGRAKTQSQ